MRPLNYSVLKLNSRYRLHAYNKRYVGSPAFFGRNSEAHIGVIVCLLEGTVVGQTVLPYL